MEKNWPRVQGVPLEGVTLYKNDLALHERRSARPVFDAASENASVTPSGTPQLPGGSRSFDFRVPKPRLPLVLSTLSCGSGCSGGQTANRETSSPGRSAATTGHSSDVNGNSSTQQLVGQQGAASSTSSGTTLLPSRDTTTRTTTSPRNTATTSPRNKHEREGEAAKQSADAFAVTVRHEAVAAAHLAAFNLGNLPKAEPSSSQSRTSTLPLEEKTALQSLGSFLESCRGADCTVKWMGEVPEDLISQTSGFLRPQGFLPAAQEGLQSSRGRVLLVEKRAYAVSSDAGNGGGVVREERFVTLYLAEMNNYIVAGGAAKY